MKRCIMENNIFYKKGKKTKKNPYGLYKIKDTDSLKGPIVITLIPDGYYEKDLNGACKVAGRAIGLIANEKDVEYAESLNIGLLSWGDTANIGVNFVSGVFGNSEELYNYYFKKILFDENGEIKDFESLAKDLRNINIISYCNSTFTVQEIEDLIYSELVNSHKFTSEQIEKLMLQICVIDVTTRIKPGSCRFTNVHLFSKSDEDLQHPEYIRKQKTGITILNNHEANIIAKQMNLNSDDHAFRVFLDPVDGRTDSASVMEVAVGVLLSNMLQSSLEGRILDEKSIFDVSLLFNEKNISVFNELFGKSPISDEKFKIACKILSEGREFLDSNYKGKNEILRELKRNLNIKLYTKIHADLLIKLASFNNYLSLYQKFSESEYFKNLDDKQKALFESISLDVQNKLKTTQGYLDALDKLALEECENNEKNKSKIEKIIKDSKSLFINEKAKSVVKAYAEVSIWKHGKSNFDTFESCEKYLLDVLDGFLRQNEISC